VERIRFIRVVVVDHAISHGHFLKGSMKEINMDVIVGGLVK
jgi:hypothetical protein